MAAARPSPPPQQPAAQACSAHARAARRGERGLILVTVSVMGVLLMALWLVAWQATHDGLRAERFQLARQQRDVALARGLAAGLHLLETGEPPSDPYACLYVVVDGADTHEVTLTYESVFYPETWTVSAAEATEEESDSLPTAPGTFE